MKVKDQAQYDDWKAKQDTGDDPMGAAYGRAIFLFAERWADRLEALIEDRAPDQIAADVIKKHAEAASHEADTEGITGFMYGAAVSILAQCWVYGEELRRWHNLDTQIHNEGERANESGAVLNPALCVIGESQHQK